MTTEDADQKPSAGSQGMEQQSQEEKIMKQVEYYFGDINLPRDKFLQEEMKKDNGWVPLVTMLKFNRLAALTTDLDLITAALKDSHLIDVSDDSAKIRRNPEVPLPENTLEYWQEIKRRTVYMKGFPQDSSLDAISEFVGQFGDVVNILMRKTKGSKETPKVFKGSVFATFVNQDQAKQLAAKKDLKFKDQEIEAKMQEAYWADKNVRRHAERELKKQKRKEAIEQQNKAHYMKGLVLKVSGLPTSSEEQQVPVPKLKQFFEPYGTPAYVMIDGAEATIRFGGNVENAAQEAWKKAVEASSEGKVLMDGSELSAVVLEGEEEARYWTEFSKARVAKVQRGQQKGRGRKEQQQQRGRENRKRAANRGNNDQQEGKKAKRTVFNDDDEVEEGGGGKETEENGGGKDDGAAVSKQEETAES